MSVINRIWEISTLRHEKWDVIYGESEMISTRIIDLLWLDLKSDQIKLLPVFWLPWAWKWWTIKALIRELQVKIKKKVSWNENELELWYIHEESNTHTLYVMLDCFFKEIWALRRTDMLRSMSNFIDMFSDDEKAIAFIQNYLDTHKSFEFDKVYLKTDAERVANAAMSKLKIMWKEDSKGSLVFIDWVNSHIISDELKKRDDSLEVIKLMVFPRLELAFQRIIRRDHVWSETKTWKPIKDVVKFRLQEAFYLFKAFTVPAMNQDNVNMVDFTPNTVHDLTREEIREVIYCLEESKDELLEEGLWKSFDKYLDDYVDILLDHFNYLLRFNKYFLVERNDNTKTDTIRWIDIWFEELAERIWNLHYDSLAEFLSLLSDKLNSHVWASASLKAVSEEIAIAWKEICKPFIDRSKSTFKHTSEVKWIHMDKETLSFMISKLTNNSLKEFLVFLSKKFKKDAKSDKDKWRLQLSDILIECAEKLKEASKAL